MTAALRSGTSTVSVGSTQYSGIKVLKKCKQLNLDLRNVPDLSELMLMHGSFPESQPGFICCLKGGDFS